LKNLSNYIKRAGERSTLLEETDCSHSPLLRGIKSKKNEYLDPRHSEDGK
jgi:hypothetical protein